MAEQWSQKSVEPNISRTYFKHLVWQSSSAQLLYNPYFFLVMRYLTYVSVLTPPTLRKNIARVKLDSEYMN